MLGKTAPWSGKKNYSWNIIAPENKKNQDVIGGPRIELSWNSIFTYYLIEDNRRLCYQEEWFFKLMMAAHSCLIMHDVSFLRLLCKYPLQFLTVFTTGKKKKRKRKEIGGDTFQCIQRCPSPFHSGWPDYCIEKIRDLTYVSRLIIIVHCCERVASPLHN